MFYRLVTSRLCHIKPCYRFSGESYVFHIINQLNAASEQLCGNHSFMKYCSSESLAGPVLHRVSTFLVNTRNQPPHNLDLIPHLVHINNPPSRAEVSPVWSAPPSLTSLFLHLWFTTVTWRGKKENNVSHPALPKHCVLITLSKFQVAWAGSACSVSGGAGSPACGPPSVTLHLVKKSSRTFGGRLSSPSECWVSLAVCGFSSAANKDKAI